MASVAEDQAVGRWWDRAVRNAGKLGRSRAVDFELGKARARARATRVEGADRKYCVDLGKQLRQRALKIPAEGFHAHRTLALAPGGRPVGGEIFEIRSPLRYSRQRSVSIEALLKAKKLAEFCLV